MIREELVFVATCDISGLARGKGFPARELPARLKKGIGWTGSNLMMSPFGPIWDTPFGTAGDFMIVPDPGAEVRVDFADGSTIEHFFLGDLLSERLYPDQTAAPTGLERHPRAAVPEHLVIDCDAPNSRDRHGSPPWSRLRNYAILTDIKWVRRGVGLATE